MAQSYTPGVRIEHVLTEPRRVLHTGVPVFLGLICEDHLQTHNALYRENKDEQYIHKAIPTFPDVFIARKRGYLWLPERPLNDVRLPDSMSANPRAYLRAVPASRTPVMTPTQAPYAGTAGQVNQTSEQPLETTATLSDKPQRFTVWPQFEATYGDLKPFGFLNNAVRGFFENDGRLCYVQVISYQAGAFARAVEAGLKSLELANDYDLVCVPDLMYQVAAVAAEPPTAGLDMTQIIALQRLIISHCDTMGDRIAILDALPPGKDPTYDNAAVLQQRAELQGDNVALYYPWLHVANGPTATITDVPPCGHVAGIIAQTDRRVGVYKAPANEIVQGVLALRANLSDEEQSPLNEHNINCLRSFPRRGIRVWGARTLSNEHNWRYLNVRRIFTTAARWIERNMVDVVFEPNTPDLWARIVRDLTFYFSDLLEQGALAGRAAGEAFYVKCNEETNPPETREVGQVITEIGLAVDVPAEFIVVRIMHGITGVRMMGPS